MKQEIIITNGIKNYALVQNYYEHHGNLKIPVKFKTLNGYEYDENGISLGTWLATQRQSYKKQSSVQKE